MSLRTRTAGLIAAATAGALLLTAPSLIAAASPFGQSPSLGDPNRTSTVGDGGHHAAAGATALADPRAPAPDFTGRRQGLDVSHWNGTIHWKRVKSSGMKFVIVKATEGTGFNDPAYARNRAGARGANLHFTAYEFADPGSRPRDPVEDAAHFVRVAGLHSADLVPVLDLEQTGGLNDANLITWVKRWCDAVEHRLGVRPIIYTSPSFWTQHMDDTTALAEAGSPLWIAHWFVQDPMLPAAEWNGTGWSLWQWTDREHVGGIAGRVDLDLLNGTSFDALTIANARATGDVAP